MIVYSVLLLLAGEDCGQDNRIYEQVNTAAAIVCVCVCVKAATTSVSA